MLMFCIAENIVHGGLNMSTAGLVSFKKRIAFSRIFRLLKSHGSPFSSVVVMSKAISPSMPSCRATLVIL